jgi:hypothetical protein
LLSFVWLQKTATAAETVAHCVQSAIVSRLELGKTMLVSSRAVGAQHCSSLQPHFEFMCCTTVGPAGAHVVVGKCLETCLDASREKVSRRSRGILRRSHK